MKLCSGPGDGQPGESLTGNQASCLRVQLAGRGMQAASSLSTPSLVVPGLHNCPTLPTWVSSGALALLFPWRPECTLIPLSRAFRWGRLKHSTTSSFWTAAANLFSPSIEPSVRPFWDVKPEAPHTWDELERQWKRLLLSQFMLRCPHSSAGLTPQPAKHTQPTIWGRSSPYCWYHKGSEGPWHLAGCASRCCQTQGCWGTLAGRWGEPALGWAWASQRPAVPENTVGACSSCLLSEPAASTSSWTSGWCQCRAACRRPGFRQPPGKWAVQPKRNLALGSLLHLQNL